jgi:hypothetical protein
MKKNNQDNFEEYMKQVKNSRSSLAPTSTQPTIAQLVAEGMKLLDEEEKQNTLSHSTPKEGVAKIMKDGLKPLPKAKVNEKNPYVLARNELINKWKNDPRMAWRAKEVEDMEAGILPKNRFWDDFVKELDFLSKKYK